MTEINRINEKLDTLVDTVHENHLEIVDRLSALQREYYAELKGIKETVAKHDHYLGIGSKLFLSGGLIGLVAFIRDFFQWKPHP